MHIFEEGHYCNVANMILLIATILLFLKKSVNEVIVQSVRKLKKVMHEFRYFTTNALN